MGTPQGDRVDLHKLELSSCYSAGGRGVHRGEVITPLYRSLWKPVLDKPLSEVLD